MKSRDCIASPSPIYTKTKSSGIFTGTDFYVETLRKNNNVEHYWRDKT